MNITEKQAIDYISGMVIVIKNKIEIFDKNNSDNTDNSIDIDFFITDEERIMCESLELVIQKAKSNIMFQKETE